MCRERTTHPNWFSAGAAMPQVVDLPAKTRAHVRVVSQPLRLNQYRSPAVSAMHRSQKIA